MRRGTKSLTRQQIEDELDKNKATLIADGDPGTATFMIHTKRGNLPAVLDLLKQILREPALPSEELELLRRSQLSSLEEQRNDPQFLAITRLAGPSLLTTRTTSATSPRSTRKWSAHRVEDRPGEEAVRRVSLGAARRVGDRRRLRSGGESEGPPRDIVWLDDEAAV